MASGSSGSSTSIGVTPKMIVNALLRLDYLGYKTRIEDIVKIVSRNFPTTSNLNRLRREIATKVRCCIAAGLLTRDGLSLKPTPRGKRPRLYKRDVATFWNVYRTLTNGGAKKPRRSILKKQTRNSATSERLQPQDSGSADTTISSRVSMTDSDYTAKDEINHPPSEDSEMSIESSRSTVMTASNINVKSPKKHKTRPKTLRRLQNSYHSSKTSESDRSYRRVYHFARFVRVPQFDRRSYHDVPRKWHRCLRTQYSSDDDERRQDLSSDSGEAVQYWMHEPRA